MVSDTPASSTTVSASNATSVGTGPNVKVTVVL